MESSLEASSLLERSRIALIEQSRIALVALVDGTLAQLDADTQAMLRTRLRLSAWVLFFGFTAFLVKHVFEMAFTNELGASFIGFHAAVTAVLGLVGLLITYRRTVSLVRLRLAELIIFGLPLAFFLAVTYFETQRACVGADGNPGEFRFRDGPWLILMFTYALFIPNTLRRAATVIGIIAAAPILLILVLMLFEPAIRTVVIGTGELTYFPLVLALCAAGSVFGVQTIDTLRHEAYEARQLGQYRLKEMIGEGGMGTVYLAEHQLLKRPCVIKLVKREKAADAKVLARFKREVRATSKLTHWNTIEIYDYGSTSDGIFYYVMEYLRGMSLGEIIKSYGPMEPRRVVHVLRQVCDALSEAHTERLIHRDIKPGNIFLAKRGGIYDVAKLLDFGLVKPGLDDEDIHLSLTAEGSIIGSPLFMSPEQGTGEGKPDARSDLYSLGAVAYYLLTGRPPFEGEQVIKVIMAHVQQEVVPPSQLRPETPADLEQIILRCLAKKPEDRFQSAAEMYEALGQCEAAGQWSRADAAQWWQEHGKKDQAAPQDQETGPLAAGVTPTGQ